LRDVYKRQTVKKLKIAFEVAVEDYIELCEEVGKDPMKSFKGSFNVRLDPNLHSKAFEKATLSGKSLNQLVQEAIGQYVVSQ
ncbi:MAG: type II toxin-antitoxin system HicB family antitoxin, partial [Spirosomataceae bacterium]